MALDIDLTAWPVAVVARPHGAPVEVGDDDGLGIGPALGPLLDRRERFGLVLDIGRRTEAQQVEFAAWLQRNRVRAQRYVVGCALVLPAATVERARDLIGTRPQLSPFPVWVAATRDECRNWVEGVLASSGPRAGRQRSR